MNKKRVQQIIYSCLVFLFVFAGCTSNVKYGYPADTLYAMNELTYDNIEDLVLFTYVPYSNEEKARQTVVVNTKTKKQYKFDNPDILRTGFYDVVYLDNKMVIPDDAGSRYVLYNDANNKGVFKQVFQASNDTSIIATDKNKHLLIVNDIQKHEIVKINLDGDAMSTFQYTETGEYDDRTGEFSGYYTFNPDMNKLLFFGKSDGKENQLLVFDAVKKQWDNIFTLDETGKYVQSQSFIDKNYFILYTPEKNKLYFLDLISNEVMIKEPPFAITYDSKVNNQQLESVHDNNLIFSGLNLDPSNLSVNESYTFTQLITQGVPRVNYINLNNPQELVFMTPEGLYVYDKNTKQLQNIIFMDTNSA